MYRTAFQPRWPVIGGKRANSPLKYFSRKKGLITNMIFAEILNSLEIDFRRQKRKVLLLVDNCSAHLGFTKTYDGERTFLKLLMLPKNTTSRLQPCNQGVIRSLKAYSRQRLLRLLFHKEAKDISLYAVLLMIRAGWKLDVKESVIKNAWTKSELVKEPAEIRSEELQ